MPADVARPCGSEFYKLIPPCVKKDFCFWRRWYILFSRQKAVASKQYRALTTDTQNIFFSTDNKTQTPLNPLLPFASFRGCSTPAGVDQREPVERETRAVCARFFRVSKAMATSLLWVCILALAQIAGLGGCVLRGGQPSEPIGWPLATINLTPYPHCGVSGVLSG